VWVTAKTVLALALKWEWPTSNTNSENYKLNKLKYLGNKDRLAILLNLLLVGIPYISKYWLGYLTSLCTGRDGCNGREMYVGLNSSRETCMYCLVYKGQTSVKSNNVIKKTVEKKSSGIKGSANIYMIISFLSYIIANSSRKLHSIV
jgi:hypothetical protein